MVPAVKREASATPDKAIDSGVAPRVLDKRRITPVAIRLEKKAAPVAAKGDKIETASDWLLNMRPAPNTITDSAAPKAAAFEMPRVKGDPRGFRKIDCITAPATERPAPATTATSV